MDEPLYDLPQLPAGPVLFAPQIFDPDAAAEERRVRPLMPLRCGHLVVLILRDAAARSSGRADPLAS